MGVHPTAQGVQQSHGRAGDPRIRTIARRAFSLAGPAFCGLALSAAGIAYADRPAAELPLRPSSLGSASAPSCPLPITRQVKAVKAFAEMMPVFRHARCLNCHGGLDLFSARHPGENQLDRQWNPAEPMAPDVRANSFAAQCMDCHDNIRRFDHPSGKGGWTTPPSPMFFVHQYGDPQSQKDDEELCLQVKAQEPTGASFVSHIHDDHGTIQFLEAAFVGDRALGEGLQDYVDARGGQLKPEKPPGSQADLTAKAQKWVDLLGDGYASSPECGCVKPRIRLEVQHRYADNTADAASSYGWVDFAGEVKFQVTLEPADSMGVVWFRADTSVVRPVTMTSIRKGCTGTGTITEEWEFFTFFQEDAETMDLRVGIYPSERIGSSPCVAHVYPTLNSDLPTVVLPLDSGGTARVTAHLDGFGSGKAQEWLTVKLLEAPANHSR
jgi:hypothetical protein